MTLPVDPRDEIPHGEVTRLLRAAEGGDRSAAEEVLRRVYDELRFITGNSSQNAAGAVRGRWLPDSPLLIGPVRMNSSNSPRNFVM